MHTIATSIIGVAVTDVRHSVTQSGLSLARFRMVSQPRRFDSTQGQFVDLDASFVTVFAWRAMADNIVASIHKGDPVVVVGRLRVREWVDGESPRVTVEVDAQSIGHDLSRGCARFSKSLRAAGAVGGAVGDGPRGTDRGVDAAVAVGSAVEPVPAASRAVSVPPVERAPQPVSTSAEPALSS